MDLGFVYYGMQESLRGLCLMPDYANLVGEFSIVYLGFSCFRLLSIHIDEKLVSNRYPQLE